MLKLIRRKRNNERILLMFETNNILKSEFIINLSEKNIVIDSSEIKSNGGFEYEIKYYKNEAKKVLLEIYNENKLIYFDTIYLPKYVSKKTNVKLINYQDIDVCSDEIETEVFKILSE